jgi:hypothetical protein
MSFNLSDDDDELNSPQKKVKSNNSYVPSMSSIINTSKNQLKREHDVSGGENLSDSDHDESHLVSKKKLKTQVSIPTTSNAVSIDSKTQQMMNKMGWKPGEGLGKHHQGIVKPIEESDQKGRRGLGFEIKEFTSTNEDWDFSKDQVSYLLI